MYPEQYPLGSTTIEYPLTFSHTRDEDTVNRELPTAHAVFSQNVHHPLRADTQQ